MEVLQELQALGQSREDGELAVERVLPEEEVKDRHVVDPASLPVGVGHGDLVQVWKRTKSICSTRDHQNTRR